jgi:hypothetical protein
VDDVDRRPIYKRTAFECPHCGAHSQQDWATCSATTDLDDEGFDPKLRVTICFACGEQTVWKFKDQVFGAWSETATIIHPTTMSEAPPRNPDMPENVTEMYDEAGAIAAASPRSASVLLRLALELLLTDIYPEAGDLNSMIAAAVKDGLPEQVTNVMDVMRFSGNKNVHEFQPDDNAATAETMFELLNIVVERLITQPRKMSSLFSALPDGYKEQVAKRNSKATDS